MSSFISTTLSQNLNCETKTSLLKILEWEFRIFVRMFAKFWASLVTQTVKNLPAMQETKVLPLGQEDPLEKGMATHSSILAWRLPWTEEPGGPQPIGLQRVRHDWTTNFLNKLDLLPCFSGEAKPIEGRPSKGCPEVAHLQLGGHSWRWAEGWLRALCSDPLDTAGTAKQNTEVNVTLILLLGACPTKFLYHLHSFFPTVFLFFLSRLSGQRAVTGSDQTCS